LNKLLLLLALFTLTSLTSSALEPINIAIINTSGGPVDVQVKLNDYTTGTPSLKYEGPINSLTPNGSGVIIVEVDNNTGTEWSDIDADQVNSYYVLDVYVESSLYAQFRLDQQILNQSQTNIIDNDGNLSPPTGTSSLGTDNNRWEDAYISQNTLHVGPDGGMTGGTEMTLSYDIPTNSGRLNIDGTIALTAKATGVTIPNALTMTNLGGSGNRNIGVDNDGNIVINTSAGVTAGDGLTIDGSNDLDVGGSATIIANADNVEVNSSATANQVLLSSGTVGTAASYGAVPLDNGNSVSGTLSVANGGTGATNLATGNFLQGNGTGAVTATKVIPTGTVVGTTDSQTLTNKTIDANSNTITNIFPDSTGKSGQYLKTEDGNLKWETVSPSAFTSWGGKTRINDLDDDFIVGEFHMHFTGSDEQTKMFYDDSKGAFRVGSVDNNYWDDLNIGNNSAVLGLGIAKGAGSFATGEGQAYGNSSTALSRGITTVVYSTAMSFGIAKSEFSTAMSYGETNGRYSTAMSEGVANGQYSVAMSRGGSYNYSSTAMSEGVATGRYSVAMSVGRAEGDLSTAMGNGSVAESFSETVVGSYNTEYTPNNTNNFDEDDRAFVVGNGIDYANRSDALVVYKNGEVVIPDLSGVGNRNIGVDSDGKLIEVGSGGAFTSAGGQTTINNLTDDFIVGAATLDYGGTGTETKMFFDDSKGAFRVGYVDGTNWDEVNIGFYSTATGYNTTATGYNTTASGNYSTAMGRNTEASGNYSTTIGRNTTANVDYSTAMGLNTNANGIASTAMGENTTASGDYSVAMGRNTTAVGNYSTAIGRSTTASGIYSTAIGFESEAAGDYTTTMGRNTAASGNYATALGRNTIASEDYSTAMGLNTAASGDYSTSMGLGTIADASSSIALGQYNDNTVTGELLTVGNGTGSSNRSNAFEVYMNGDVVVPALSGTGNRNIGVDSDGKLIEVGSGGAFTSFGGQTTINNLTDDFIVGDATLDYDGSGADTKMFFDDSKGAFRAGSVTDGSWDDGANIGVNSFALGRNTKANGTLSTAMGSGTTASGESSTAMGNSSTASGESSTAMGNSSTASGESSTAMGYRTEASDDYSVAMGYESEASGSTSFAMGRETFASGDFTVAMGYETSATENYSTAMGYRTQANGQHSFAIGQSSKASGENSHAIGYFSEAEGWHTTAIGYESIARGDYSFAVGYKANAGGWASTAMGDSSNATGDYSTTTGYHTTASGYYATAMGHNTISPSFAETAIGAYNTDYTIATDGDTQWNAADRLFVIGNGTGTGSKSDAMIVYKNGNMDVNGDLDINDGSITLSQKTGVDADNLSTNGQYSVIILNADGAGANAFPTVAEGTIIVVVNTHGSTISVGGIDFLTGEASMVVYANGSWYKIK